MPHFFQMQEERNPVVLQFFFRRQESLQCLQILDLGIERRSPDIVGGEMESHSILLDRRKVVCVVGFKRHRGGGNYVARGMSACLLIVAGSSAGLSSTYALFRAT